MLAGVANHELFDEAGMVELELAVAVRRPEAEEVAVFAGVLAVEGGGVGGEESALANPLPYGWAGRLERAGGVSSRREIGIVGDETSLAGS
jgi:hypothetical protein